jgi:hypothetical protein
MSLSLVTAVPTTPLFTPLTTVAYGDPDGPAVAARAAAALAAADAALAAQAPEPITLDGTSYVLYGASGEQIQSYGAVAYFSRAAYLNAGMWLDEDERPAILPIDPIVHLSLVA